MQEELDLLMAAKFACFMNDLSVLVKKEIEKTGNEYTKLIGVQLLLLLLQDWMEQNSPSQEQREKVIPTLIELVNGMAEASKAEAEDKSVQPVVTDQL